MCVLSVMSCIVLYRLPLVMTADKGKNKGKRSVGSNKFIRGIVLVVCKHKFEIFRETYNLLEMT